MPTLTAATAPQPPVKKDCKCPACIAEWGAGGCPDLRSVPPDLVRPRMEERMQPSAGRRVRAVEASFAHTQAYHALYLPRSWKPGGERRYPVIVEYMGNGPWHDPQGDVSSGRPEDSNLGWGMGGGDTYIWVSMPFLTSDLGNATAISTYWWGCPTADASRSCGAHYDPGPTVRYAKSTVAEVIARYGGDPDRVVLTGWSRGAIAAGAIGLFDDEISRLWRAFLPYSHLDGDCGWVDAADFSALARRYERLKGRAVLYSGECNVATQAGPAFLAGIEQRGAANFTFLSTGFANHNDAWVLRPSAARDAMRRWLEVHALG